MLDKLGSRFQVTGSGGHMQVAILKNEPKIVFGTITHLHIPEPGQL